MSRLPPKILTGTNCVVSPDHVYQVPIKMIRSPNEMPLWEHSEAYLEYLGFIQAINQAVEGKSNSEGSKNWSEQIVKLYAMLNDIDKLIDESPPVEQPQRFGNSAFRTFHRKLKENMVDMLQRVLPEDIHISIPELLPYLEESFGNVTRIDYGTGHEISFVMFLCCLYKIGFLVNHDKAATGCKIFTKYLEICRKLQQTYRMEPAGSHGVWSLDDYQFVPFIWGSAQLMGHPLLEPASILKSAAVDEHANEYMFMSCIKYINRVKTGPFSEHSNQLWNVSGVPTWSKVNGGLVKMYKAEVLAKFPVVQHIVFGSLFRLIPAERNTAIHRMKSSFSLGGHEVQPLFFLETPDPIGDQPDEISEMEKKSNAS